MAEQRRNASRASKAPEAPAPQQRHQRQQQHRCSATSEAPPGSPHGRKRPSRGVRSPAELIQVHGRRQQAGRARQRGIPAGLRLRTVLELYSCMVTVISVTDRTDRVLDDGGPIRRWTIISLYKRPTLRDGCTQYGCTPTRDGPAATQSHAQGKRFGRDAREASPMDGA